MNTTPTASGYTELVKRLRSMAKWNENVANNMRGDPESKYERAEFLEQAASAIEALTAERDNLKFIINEIDGALCNYCNTVEDTDHPFHPLDATAQKRTFKALCDAYNLWHDKQPEIGEISMQFFRRYERFGMVLRDITALRSVDEIKRRAQEALDDAERNLPTNETTNG